ncbi:MAG: hypothetical protein NWE98_04325 [Candidatus Bathyarchaeota archaeon]|nr:hypothetical protein [Candidatus Bathyarchaeota archaeon]
MAGLLWNRSGDDVGLVKADSEGNMLWLKNFPGLGSPSSMIQASDGNYVLCSGMLDKIDVDGKLVWSRNVSYGSGSSGATYLVVQTSDGGYAVAGTVSSMPTNPEDITSYVWIGKLNSEGNHSVFIPELPSAAPIILAVITIFIAVIIIKKLATTFQQKTRLLL